MAASVVTLHEVRRALRASSIEARSLRFDGQRRRCREVGLLMMRTDIQTVTIARFRHAG